MKRRFSIFAAIAVVADPENGSKTSWLGEVTAEIIRDGISNGKGAGWGLFRAGGVDQTDESWADGCGNSSGLDLHNQ